MIKIIKADEFNTSQASKKQQIVSEEVRATVAAVIADVANRGDAAVCE